MKSRFSPYLAALSATLLVMVGVWIVDRSEQKRFRQQSRTDVLNQLSTIRARLEGGLTSRIFLARGLVANVSLDPDISQKKFERLAKVMVAQQTGIGSIALYKDNIITHIYPLKGHEAAIGFSPMTVPAERQAIERAIQTRNTIVAGPVNLVEGGVGIISRTPIFLSPAQEAAKSGRYWGLAGIIIDRDALFTEAGLSEQGGRGTGDAGDAGEEFTTTHSALPRSSLQISLRGKDGLGKNGEVFFGEKAIFEKNPIILEVNFPNGSWQIAAIPLAGWPNEAPISGWLRTGGRVLALVMGYLVFILVRSPTQLRNAVDRATAALRESETKYRELVQNANSIILRTDTRGNITFFNEFAQNFFGYTEAEILGNNLIGTIVPETDLAGKNLVENIQNILKHPERYNHQENENIRRNGDRVWIVWRNQPLFDGEGRCTGILAIGNDISDRKIAEAKLQESEQKFRTLYESTIDAVMLLDETAFFDCNPATLQVFGCTNQEEFYGKHPSEFSPEFQPNGKKSSELAAQKIATALREGSCRFEWLHCRLDGTEFPAEVWLTAVDWSQENGENEVNNYCIVLNRRRVVQAVVRDITERKRVEESLQASSRRLRRQSHALLDLATRKTLVSADVNAAIREITEVATATLDVERASVWIYNEERSTIICLDLYKRSLDTHTSGIELHAVDFPAYFEALKSERIIAAHDANTDPRTCEFSASYLTTLGITSMLDAPIRVGGQMVGVICHEHIDTARQWALEEENFAASLADFVALAMESASRMKAQEELQKVNEKLEMRVEERTAALKESNKHLRIEIIERKRSEEALGVSEEKFSKAFRSSPQIITITTLKDGRYVDVNETFLNLMGFQREEAIGHTVMELNIWLNLSDRNRMIQMLQVQGTVRNQECEFRKKSGEILVSLLSAEIIHLNGEACLLVVATDITELKKAQAARSQMAAILEATPDFVGSFDAEGRLLLINSGGRRMLGISENEDICQLTISDAHPEWASKTIAIEGIPTAISKGIWSGESAVLCRDGREIPVSQVIVAHQTANGEVAYFSTILRDITYRVKMEEALRQAEEKYRTIFENAVEGIFQTSPHGGYLSANPALARLYGYSSPQELIANIQNIQDQLYVDPNRRSEFVEVMQRQNAVSRFESQVYCKDGNIIWVSENARAVRDRNGDLLYYEGIVEDITARKLAEEALRYQQAQTERLLLNILPKPIAERLKLEESTIADSFESVTILFADLVGFTELSNNIHPVDLVELLNKIFSSFDALTDRHGLEKIKTIGDAYMVVGGLPAQKEDHAEAVAEMALDMQREINRFNAESGKSVHLRVGINTGPVVAGVIGTKKFIYDLWGDAVNTASRMESHGIAGKVHVSSATYKLLKDKYLFQKRGRIPVKGKGEMITYFLVGKK